VENLTEVQQETRCSLRPGLTLIVFLFVLKIFSKEFKFKFEFEFEFYFFSLLQINIFLVFLNYFDALISNIIFIK